MRNLHLLILSLAIIVQTSGLAWPQQSPVSNPVTGHDINGLLVAIDSNGKSMVAASRTGLAEWITPTGERVVWQVPTMAELQADFSQDEDQTNEALRRRVLARVAASMSAIANQERITEETFAILAVLNNFGQDFSGIEAVDEQRTSLVPILNDYEKEIAILREKYTIDGDERSAKELDREIQHLQNQFGTKIRSILLPHQIAVLHKWSPDHAGIFHTLTETPVGKYLSLTEGQQDALRSKTDKAIEKLKKAVDECRREIKSGYEAEISQEQREKIDRFFGKKLEQQLMKSSASHLIFFMDYPEAESTQESKLNGK